MNETGHVQQPTVHSFQAEVKQVLDIVIHSLYTHREIFVRELISNAVDALEKVRYEKLSDQPIVDADAPLEIHIDVDESAKTITFSDTGIGMTEDEVNRNLGAIAHSGTKEFLQKIKESQSSGVNLIGQFGVGFYSSFMVAERVTVETRSYRPDAIGIVWESDGSGEYTTLPKEGLKRGAKITLRLREDAHEFASAERLKEIVQKYSNFVPFPILIDGEKVNTVQAIWTKNKNQIQDEEYKEFYKFIANAFDEPLFYLHFSSDAPIQLNALLFVPSTNVEQFGFGKTDPGVNLYCRKVLIQQHSDAIFPDWLRFVKGVVDSEDLPLNISRETMQDNALVQKLRKAVTSRFVKFLADQLKNNRDGYIRFWKQFHLSIKEGIISDFDYRKELAPLLLFESSKTESGQYITLDEYISRMRLGQKDIYYLSGPSRELIQTSPYMETFLKKQIEVLYLYEPADDFVLNALQSYQDKKFQSVDQGDLELPDVGDRDEESEGERLNRDDAEILAGWIKKVLGDRVDAVRPSKRLIDSPAMIVHTDSFMTASMQKVMQAVNKDFTGIGKKSLEINPSHPIMIRLNQLKRTRAMDDPLLSLAVETIYHNAMAAAGLVTDPRTLVQTNYELLQHTLASQTVGNEPTTEA